MDKPGKIRTIFIGTPDFGLPVFKSLHDSENFAMIAAISQPDKKVGRKQLLTAPPIKLAALELKLPVLQPEKISSIAGEIENYRPDLIIVIAYAQIIPETILAIPKYGCINLHGSLLPKYRGAACIQAAILHGDSSTGLTLIRMDKGLDTGPIIAKKMIPIAADDTAGSLYAKLSNLGGSWLPDAAYDYISGNLPPKAQDEATASYVGILKKADGHIDWHKPALEIERFIRAMSPWPGAHSKLRINNSELKIIKIIESEQLAAKINKLAAGTLFSELNKLFVQCGQDALEIKILQLEGKKPTSADDFIRGYPSFLGKLLT